MRAGLFPGVDEDSLFVAHDDVGFLVAVDVGGHDLCAYAAVCINEVRDVTGFAAFAFEFEPVNHERRIRLGVAARAVSPAAFAGDDVEETVAIHVCEVDGVRLREGDAGVAGAFVGAGDEVFYPALDATFVGLLVPCDAPAVCCECADNVGFAVAVDVSQPPS